MNAGMKRMDNEPWFFRSSSINSPVRFGAALKPKCPTELKIACESWLQRATQVKAPVLTTQHDQCRYERAIGMPAKHLCDKQMYNL